MLRNLLLALFATLIFTANNFAQTKPAADSLIVEGIRLHDAGQYQQALKKFDQALDIDKNNGYALFEKANTYYTLKDTKKALKYLDIIIDKKIQESYSDACYLKGNLLDEQGKSEEAIATYRMGIKNGKPHPMLHFNLGITLMGQKKYDEAEKEYIETLKLRPFHASSHYYLGMIEAEKGLKVKAILPLYFFLTIETEGERTGKAWGIIQRTLKAGYEEKDARTVNINLDPDALNDDFKSGEMILSLAPVMFKTLRDQLRDSLNVDIPEPTATENLVQTNEKLFQMLAEDNERPTSDNFWWDFYGAYFIQLHKDGHTAAASHYIAFSGGEADAGKWLSEHETELNAFAKWYDDYWSRQDE